MMMLTSWTLPKDGHIFASPEALLQSVKWQKLLLNPDVVNGLVALVIDEAHCIVKWCNSHVALNVCIYSFCL